MTYRLYGDRRSGSATVELALAEIGAEVELCDLSLDDEAQRGADYETVNAQRKLPTLITPNGETITESAAILLTLAERHSEANLLPQVTEPARAQALRWLLFVATEIYPLVEILDYPERFLPEGEATSEQRRNEVRAHLRCIWKRRWQIVEDTVAGDPWMLGSGFSVVDIYLAVVSRWAQLDEWRTQHLSRIERIARGISERPACRDVWRRHFG